MGSNANNWPMSKIVTISVAAGAVILLLLWLLLGFAFWGALFWSLCVGAIIFLILWLNYSDPDDSGAGYGASVGAGSMGAGPSGPANPAGQIPAAEAPATETVAPEAAAPDTSGVVPTDGGAVIAPSKDLPGQADLAGRKGEWKYQGDTESGGAKADTTGPTGEDYDGDGTVEGTGEGEKPGLLDGPRDSGADNLKEIKGVGPKLEIALNDIGVYHFDQIANWNPAEVAWVNANLIGFKGRVSRDNWVEQAKILAAGGETEFSKRVDKGGVY